VLEELPAFMTVEQAAKAVQLGRSKAYQLTVEWERTGGASGLPFVWFGRDGGEPPPGPLIGGVMAPLASAIAGEGW
jgi:hypothetical protein